jgi:hypothetical protein
MDVVVYNLSKNSWIRPPNNHSEDGTSHNLWDFNVLAFEPRLDVKVQ